VYSTRVVCSYSIALTFHIRRKADINIEKKSRAEYIRQYGLKRTLEMKQSDIEQKTCKKSESNRKKNYKYNFYLVIEVPDHVYVLGLTSTCHTYKI